MKTSSSITTRRICLARRGEVGQQVQAQASQRICSLIQPLNVYQKARCVAFYQAINGEIDLSALLLHAQSLQKQCCIPRLNPDKTLSFYALTRTTRYSKNAFNIDEPLVDGSPLVLLAHIDLAIVPVVAFDQHGTRLGHGQGYYDRTFAKDKPNCIMGVAYAFQYQMDILRQPWDVPLNAMVTENGVQWWP